MRVSELVTLCLSFFLWGNLGGGGGYTVPWDDDGGFIFTPSRLVLVFYYFRFRFINCFRGIVAFFMAFLSAWYGLLVLNSWTLKDPFFIYAAQIIEKSVIFMLFHPSLHLSCSRSF